MLELILGMLLASMWNLPAGMSDTDFQFTMSGLRVVPVRCQGRFQIDNRQGPEKLKMHYKHRCRPHIEEEDDFDLEMIWRLDQSRLYTLNAKSKTYQIIPIDKSQALYQSLISGELSDSLPSTRQTYFDGTVLWTHPSKSLPWIWRIEDPHDHHISDITTLAKGLSCHMSLAKSQRPVTDRVFNLPTQYHPEK